MEFTQAKEYIEGLGNRGIVPGLCNIKELLKRLGNPQEELKIIHVAGTNGKGSVIAYLSAVLVEAGYKTGKYTSPAVFEYLEDYQINNKNIKEQDFAIIVEKVKQAADGMQMENIGCPTKFEVKTAIAFEYFFRAGCDVVLLETGMGGDGDATNVCDKVIASIIMSISLDHQHFLGETITEIASHKAGIIKRGCPVILYKQSEEVMDVIKTKADKLGAPVVTVGADEQSEVPFKYIATTGEIYAGITPGLKGHWQISNTVVAIETVEALKKQGFHISEENVVRGIENTKWSGRFEKISDEPCIIIDGAHNPGAALKLRETLIKDYEDTQLIFIMGVLADKDFSEVIRLTADRAEKIITITPENSRALEAEKLAEAVKLVNKNVVVAESVGEAVSMAKDEYRKLKGKRMILAFGSLSYLGKLRELCMETKE